MPTSTEFEGPKRARDLDMILLQDLDLINYCRFRSIVILLVLLR